jgi:hypothetical protein
MFHIIVSRAKNLVIQEKEPEPSDGYQHNVCAQILLITV